MSQPIPHVRVTLLHAFRGKYGRLLALQILLMAFLPMVVRGRVWAFALSSITSVLLVAAVHAANPRRRSIVLALLLTIPYLCCNELGAFEGMRWLLPAQAFLAFAMLVYATIAILGFILESSRVTTATLQASLCAYLLLGLVWGYLFAMIELAAPGSFRIPHEPTTSLTDYLHIRFRFTQLIYFSYASLTTLGFGDITPVNGFAQMAACLEAITGQVYLAILVARLVGMHISSESSRS